MIGGRLGRGQQDDDHRAKTDDGANDEEEAG